MYVALYALGTLCRYHPEKWNPFIRNDITGEKLLVEKFTFYARRLIPNLALNHITGKRMCFTNDKYRQTDKTTPVSRNDVQKIIEEEMRKLSTKGMRMDEF